MMSFLQLKKDANRFLDIVKTRIDKTLNIFKIILTT